MKVFLTDIEEQLKKETADFNLNLMDRHEQLIQEVTGLMQAYQLLKKKIFALGKNALTSDPLSISYA